MSLARSVLFVNRVAPPASGATGWMLHDLAAALRARGRRATSVTLGPAEGPRSLGPRAARGLAEARALARKALAVPADVVVLMTDPPLLPLATGRFQRRGRRVLHWVMDLYPDVADALGVVPAPIAGVIGAPLRRARRRADAVVALGEDMAGRLRAQGVDRPVVVPNWSPPGIGPSAEGGDAFRARHGLDGFVLLYAGNLGMAHPTEALFEAGRRLAAEGATLVVVGGGVDGRARVEGAGARWLPAVPRDQLGACLGAADAHVVIQDPRTLGMLVPSKVYGAAATGRPVAFLGPPAADAATVARATPRGTVLATSDADGLVGWVRALAGDAPAPGAPDLPSVEAAAEVFETLIG